MTARILVVDDEPSMRRQATLWLEGEGYSCVPAASAEEALEHLSAGGFDVVVTDIHMRRISGIGLLRAVKRSDPETQVIVITGNPQVDFAVRAMRSNADDYLIKPFEFGQLSHSVKRALEHRALLVENRAHRLHLEERVREQAQHIERLFLDGLAALAAAVEARDQYTGDHLDRVTNYALSTGGVLGLEDRRMWSLWLSSLFHDVGKLAIPDSILNKSGPLTDEEFAVMKRHPELGVKVVGRVSFLQPAVPGILHHQERWDGTGYPAGLSGERISIEGRILAVSDAFDAMLTDRPYRPACSEEEALDELVRYSGRQFDPAVVDAFLLARETGFPTRRLTSLYSGTMRRS